jgi:hypothetical protein
MEAPCVYVYFCISYQPEVPQCSYINLTEEGSFEWNGQITPLVVLD